MRGSICCYMTSITGGSNTFSALKPRDSIVGMDMRVARRCYSRIRMFIVRT